MAPEYIAGSNMCKLFKDEKIEGIGSGGPITIKGPAIVRFFAFPDLERFLIQGPGGEKLEVKGTVFEDVVQKVE